MKTNSAVRWLVRIRGIVICLALLGLVVAEVGFGESLASRYGQYTAAQTQSPQAPSLSLGDLMAAASVVQ